MCEPASYDLGNRIRAPDTVPWVNWYSDVSGAEGGFWTAYGGHPCQRDAISCPSGSQSVCLSGPRDDNSGAEAGTSTSHFLLPNGCASFKLTTAAFVVEPAVQTRP